MSTCLNTEGTYPCLRTLRYSYAIQFNSILQKNNTNIWFISTHRLNRMFSLHFEITFPYMNQWSMCCGFHVLRHWFIFQFPWLTCLKQSLFKSEQLVGSKSETSVTFSIYFAFLVGSYLTINAFNVLSLHTIANVSLLEFNRFALVWSYCKGAYYLINSSLVSTDCGMEKRDQIKVWLYQNLLTNNLNSV